MKIPRERTRPRQAVPRRERPSQSVENRRKLQVSANGLAPSLPGDAEKPSAHSQIKSRVRKGRNRSPGNGVAPASEAADYEVGYGKTPKQHQWKPGQSGNPKGRPKKSRNLSTMVVKEATRLISVTENGRTRKATVNEVILRNIANEALKGDLKAIKLWLDLAAKFAAEDTAALVTDTLSANDMSLLEQMFALGGEGQPDGNEGDISDPSANIDQTKNASQRGLTNDDGEDCEPA